MGSSDQETSRPPASVTVLAWVHGAWGVVCLLLLLVYVVLWSRQEKGELQKAWGGEADWADLYFAFWLAYGLSGILVGVWLNRMETRGMWLALLLATLMLGAGMSDIAQAEIGLGDVLLHFLFPLATFWIVVRHRAGFRRPA